jgi:hypothetical protein
MLLRDRVISTGVAQPLQKQSAAVAKVHSAQNTW